MMQKFEEGASANCKPRIDISTLGLESAWGLLYMGEKNFDFILADEKMPVPSEAELLGRLRDAGHNIRVVEVRGHLGGNMTYEFKCLGVHGIPAQTFHAESAFYGVEVTISGKYLRPSLGNRP